MKKNKRNVDDLFLLVAKHQEPRAAQRSPAKKIQSLEFETSNPTRKAPQNVTRTPFPALTDQDTSKSHMRGDRKAGRGKRRGEERGEVQTTEERGDWRQERGGKRRKNQEEEKGGKKRGKRRTEEEGGGKRRTEEGTE